MDGKIPPPGIYPRYVKRGADILLVLLFLVCGGWIVLLLLTLLVRFFLGTPVIFRQERPGLNEKPFQLYKFRTMTDRRDADGNLLPDQERLTRAGLLLRKTSLDELPEIWNILRGEMSFIGPRPLLMRYLPYYTDEERKRALVRPGISGLAQVRGRNLLTWKKRFEADVEYVNNISLLLDVKIIFQTFAALFRTDEIKIGDSNLLLDFDVERKQEIEASGKK